MPVMGLQGLEGYFGGVNPFGEGTVPGAGGSLNMNRVRANMNPFQNSWDGDKFNIGKPQVNGGPRGIMPMPDTSLPTPSPGTGGGGLQPGGSGGMNPFMLAQMGAGMMGGGQRMQVSDLNPMPGGPMQAPQMPQMPPAVQARMRQANPLRQGMY